MNRYFSRWIFVFTVILAKDLLLYMCKYYYNDLRTRKMERLSITSETQVIKLLLIKSLSEIAHFFYVRDRDETTVPFTKLGSDKSGKQF